MPKLIVTPAILGLGYPAIVRGGFRIEDGCLPRADRCRYERRRYEVIERLADGNYLVVDPHA